MTNKEDILAKWLSGEVTDAELVASEGVDALKELKQVKAEVDQWSMPRYDIDDNYHRLKKNLEQQAPSSRSTSLVKIIAIVVIACLLGWGLFVLMATDKIKAGDGETIHYAFYDGSEVWLNDGSSIKYQSDQWSSQRSIDLKGEALFEVSKGTPFTVHTAHGAVTVLGTRFNVRAWGGNLYVECYEGMVQITSQQQSTIITASESVHVIKGNMETKKEIDNTAPSWQNGSSRFYDDQLTTVCEELARQYQITVDLKASDRTFSGVFKHDDLETALRSICKPLQLEYTISTDKKTVVIE